MELSEVLSLKPYSLPQNKKEKLLLDLVKMGLKENLNSPYVKSYYKKLNITISKIPDLASVPYIHASMFKHFPLQTVSSELIVRKLTSSATTSQTPSVISLDKITALRQTKALVSILSDFIGSKKIPFLIFDLPYEDKSNALSARGAGVRGFLQFASSTHYAVKDIGGELTLDHEVIQAFQKSYSQIPSFGFGFTYIIWKLLSTIPKSQHYTLKKLRVFHGGGWKRLEESKVTPDVFTKTIAQVLGCESQNIIDYYGMIETTGIIFIDCNYKNKHVPIFADVIIRDIATLLPVSNKEGFIEIINALPNSYPGHAIITDDKGILLGVDSCPCGRKGKYFRFTTRVKMTEVRGCGDTIPALR